MLTYAVVDSADLAETALLRNVERFPTVFEADTACLGGHVFVFHNDDLIRIITILSLWEHWWQRGRLKNLTNPVQKWGRRVELYIRLRLKLRARRVRLSAEGCYDGRPAKQCTSKARPAA